MYLFRNIYFIFLNSDDMFKLLPQMSFNRMVYKKNPNLMREYDKHLLKIIYFFSMIDMILIFVDMILIISNTFYILI